MAAHHPHDDVRTRDGSGVLTVDAPGIGGGTARTDASTPDLHDDGLLAERAWRDGHTIVAIDVADRALAAGTDPGGRAAGVA
ncbi:MAG: hypothetical protein LH603_03620, partial [Pseudonocardia sp.]|nr:hypothetical protein [Pseudonocardia sp.]